MMNEIEGIIRQKALSGEIALPLDISAEIGTEEAGIATEEV